MDVSAASPTVKFTALGGNPNPGATIAVPVKASGFANVSTFQFSLGWDKTVLQFQNLSSTFGIAGLSGGSFNTTGAAGGAIAVSWDDPDGSVRSVADDTVLFTVNFLVLSGNGTFSDVSFTSTPTAQEVTVNLASATFSGVKGTVVIGTPEAPTIQWGAPAAIGYGTALSTTQLAASTTAAGTLEYTPAVGTVLPAGTHTLTVNFTPSNPAAFTAATKSVSLTVNKASLTVTADDKTRAYNQLNPTLTTKITGFVNGDNASALTAQPVAATVAVQTSPGGTYPITFSTQATAANYAITHVDGVLTVTKLDPVVTWTTPAAITYGTSLSSTQLSAGSATTGTFAYTPAANAVLTAGSQTLSVVFTPTDSGGFNPVTKTVTLVVDQASLTATAQPVTRGYGQANPTDTLVTLTGSVAGDGITAKGSVVGVAIDAAVGDYPNAVVPALQDPNNRLANYKTPALVNAALKVTKVPLTVAPASFSKVYGDANPVLTGTVTGLREGDGITASYTTTATAASGVNTYPITASLSDPGSKAANYDVTLQTGTLTVTKAALTATADDKSRKFGESNPVFTVTYKGFVNGDTTTAVGTPPTLATVATSTSPAGNYQITVTGGVGANYEILPVAGKMTVGKAGVTLMWSQPAVIQYGTALTSVHLNATAKSSVDGSPVAGTFVYTPGAGTVLPAGLAQTLSAVFTPADTANFESASIAPTIDVTKAPLTAKATNLTKRVGADNPTLRVDYTGFVNGDTAATAITAAPVLSTTAVKDSPLGTYPINFTTPPVAPNYNVTTQYGSLTVNLNALPVFTDIADPTIPEDGVTGVISFSVSDPDGAPGAVPSVTALSDNLTLLPASGINLIQTGAALTLQLTPAANQFGTAKVTLSGTDAEGGVGTKVITLTVISENDLPTITSIANQTINEDTQTGDLGFTVGDVETAAGSLTLKAVSSNPTLVPDANVTFSGSGASRTVRVTPAAQGFGSATITVTVTDADGGAASRSFAVNVTSVNDVPTITAISDQTVDEDKTLGPIAFTIDDIETVSADLQVAVSFDGTTIFTPGSVSMGSETGKSRTMKLTPMPNANGKAVVTVRVTDKDGAFAESTFAVTVKPINDPPLIFEISPQTFPKNTTLGPVPFTIKDVDTAADKLTIVLRSATPTLLPNEGLILGGSGYERTFNVTPATDGVGDGAFDIEVSDGEFSVTNRVTVTVLPIITPVITWAPPAAIVYGVRLGAGQLNATTDVEGVFDYSPSAGVALPTGMFNLTVVFTPNDLTRYAVVTKTVPLLVNKAPLTIRVQDRSKFYGDPNPTLAATYTGFVNGDTAASLDKPLALSTTALVSSPPNSYPILGTEVADADYAITVVPGALTVDPAPLRVTAVGVSRAFGTENPAFEITYSGFKLSDSVSTLTARATASTTATRLTPVGNYSIVPSGVASSLYAFTLVPGNLAIVAADTTITWAEPAPIEYGTRLTRVQLNATASNPGTLDFTPPVGTLLGAGSRSLLVRFTPADPSNFRSVEKTVNLTVTPRPLTVTADNKSRAFGASNPALSYKIEGLIPGEREQDVLSSPVALATTASPSSPVGLFPIIVSSGAAANYSVVRVPGVLEVKTAIPALAWVPPAAIPYGTPLGSVVLNPTSDVPGVFTFVPAAGTVLPVGSTTLQAVFTPEDKANVAAGEISVPVKVNPATLVIQAQDVSRPFGAKNPALPLVFEGFLNGDGPSVLSPAPRAATLADLSSPGGTYPITISATGAKNYIIEAHAGVLTVQNGAPSINGLGNIAVPKNGNASISFDVTDPETSSADLQVRVSSSNTGLVPDSGLALGGSADHRTLTVKPAANAVGSATLRVVVSDGFAETAGTLSVTVVESTGAGTSVQGSAQDGYIAGALVFFDANGNRVRDPDEPSTTTDGNGRFDLNVDVARFDTNKNGRLDPSEGTLVMTGGIDIATGVRQTAPLVAPAGSTVITPLTTLLTAVLEASPNTDVATAEKKLAASLGLPSQVSVTSFDAVAAAANNDPTALKVLNVAAKVQDTTALGTALLSGAGQSTGSASKNVTSALAAAVLGSSTLDLTSGSATKGVLSDAAAKSGTKLSDSLLSTASDVVSSVNQAKDSAANSGTVVSGNALEVSRVQVVAQGALSDALSKAASGEASVDDVASLGSAGALQDAIGKAPVGVLVTPEVARTGRIGFSAANFQVNEDGSALVPVAIYRKGGSDGAIRGSVTIVAETGSTAGDFTTNRIQFVLADREINRSIDLSAITINDSVAEGEKHYRLILDVLDPNTRSTLLDTQSTAALAVADDESVGAFEFVAPRFTVSESGASAGPIQIRRSGGSAGSVDVRVNITVPAGSSARLPADYSASSVLVNFPEGVMTKRVQLPLVNDDRVEPTETLALSLAIESASAGVATVGRQGTALVSVEDDDPNHAPVAGPDTATVAQGQSTEIEASKLLANDIDSDPEDSLRVVSVDDRSESGGSVRLSGGTVVYTPRARFSGIDRFGYTVADTFGGTARGVVTVTVRRVNAVPTTGTDVLVLATPTDSITVNGTDLMRNDFDAEAGSVLRIVSVSTASTKGGKVTLASSDAASVISGIFVGDEAWTNVLTSSTIVYTPPAGLSADDEFTYRVVDAEGGAAEGRVVVRINTAPQVKPPAAQRVVTGHSTVPAAIVVADGQSAASELALTAASSNETLLPASGISLGRRGDSRLITLTPVKGAVGTAKVTLTVTDPQGASSSASFELTVEAASKDNDVDGDGHPDLFIHHTDGYLGIVSVDQNRVVNARFLEPLRLEDQGWKPVVSADLDGDGFADLVFQHSNGTIGYWTLNGLKRVEMGLFDPANIGESGWRIVAAADFNGDHKADLVLQHKDGLLGVFLMDGVRVASAGFLQPASIPDPKWNVIGAADLDHDGHPDLVLQHEDGSMGVWYMDGVVQRKAQFTTPASPGDAAWRACAVIDISGDGQPDIVFQHTNGAVATWVMGGADGSNLVEPALLEPPFLGDGWKVIASRP